MTIHDFLRDKIKKEFIKNKYIIPTDDILNKEITKVIESSDSGIIGSIELFLKKDLSNPDVYGANFLTIKTNIEYLIGEVFNKLNNIIDIINDSTTEKNQIYRELKFLERDFNDVELGKLHSDGLKYVISDSFIDSENIDLIRSNAEFNFNAGTVSLNTSKSINLPFTHYSNINSINFTITEGISTITKQEQTPGSKFGGIFNSNETDRWEYIVYTSKPVTVEGFFTLKLSNIGESLEINSINLKTSLIKNTLMDNDLISIHYLKDNEWLLLPNAKIDLDKSEILLEFPVIKTTHLKFTWTKYIPDTSNAYVFSITELNVRKNDTVYESTFTTKPLRIKPFQTEKPTITSIKLDVNKRIQDGSSTKFYIGIDELVDGKVVDSNGNIVNADSDTAYAFVPNELDENGNLETYTTYISELRDNPHISGALLFKQWEPKWQEILPNNEINNNIKKQLYFNISDFDKEVHDLYYSQNILWGDSSYTGTWPVEGSDWNQDWEGNPGDAPKSGYIWGESPLMSAGVFWGDGRENAGWYRPNTPNASGILEEVNKNIYPDFIVKDKYFWKIFKWPSTSIPVDGTVKLSIKNISGKEEINNTTNNWKWNYKSNTSISEYTSKEIVLDENVSFYTFRAHETIFNKSDIKIIKDSITNVKFTNITPSDIDDFIIEYGYEYVIVDGIYVRQLVEEQYQDSTFTIVFNRDIIKDRNSYNDITPSIQFTFDYESKTQITASWDGFFIVPENAIDGFTCKINQEDTSIQKVLVQQLSDNGIILQSKEYKKPNTFDLYKGLNLVRIFVNTEVNQNDITDESIATWTPNDKVEVDDVEMTVLTYGYNVQSQTTLKTLTEVSINTLLYETEKDDNTKFAIITDVDDSKYIVVKQFETTGFPTDIVNNLHYTRTYYDVTEEQYITYTTGTQGNYNGHPTNLDGLTLEDRPANTKEDVLYPNISTYGETINVEDPSSSGFLYYNSGENLQTIYDIKYSVPINNKFVDKVFLMGKLLSNNINITPVINSYSLIINDRNY